MFINNFFKRVILLASEFFEVAVMRRPDHKFSDQWRKADSALQPRSTLSFFLHFERFLLTRNPFLRYTYMDLRIFFFCICLLLNFLSVLTFASFFLSLDGLRPITPVLQDPVARESTGERRKKKNRGILSIMVEFNISSLTLRLSPAPLMLPQIR